MSPFSEQREVSDLGLKLFISNPRKGVKFLVEKNILSENPKEIVRFILKYWLYINLQITCITYPFIPTGKNCSMI